MELHVVGLQLGHSDFVIILPPMELLQLEEQLELLELVGERHDATTTMTRETY